MITSLTFAALAATEFVVVDLGRLTPFGRTIDIYIKADDRPRNIRAGQNQAFWSFEGDAWTNAPSDLPFWDGSLVDPAYAECMSTNGANDLYYYNPSVPQFFEPTSLGFNAYDTAASEGLEWWATSWFVMNNPSQLSGNISNPDFVVVPRVPLINGNLLADGASVFYSAADGYPCFAESCGGVYNWYFCGLLMQFKMYGDGRTWESTEMPGHYRIARITGAESFELGGEISFDDNSFEYADVSWINPNASCPADLNEDGTVGFDDFITVVSDVSAGKYSVDGFNALVTVLSGWGDCP